jgi:small subunit ribosomal protein S4e
MLDKLSGIFAPRPRAGAHKLRESLPLMLIIRNRLKYALSASESTMIIKQRKVKVDGKVRTDTKFPVGFMDVVSIPDTDQRFRILLDPKGRQTLVPVDASESHLKLLKVRKTLYTPGRVPVATCHDGRVIRYPDPLLHKNDTIVFDLEKGTVLDWVRFKLGCLVMVTGGANTGRVGTIQKIERHPGSFHIVHVTDLAGHSFATRIGNIFVIGRPPVVKSGTATPLVTLPRDGGIRRELQDDREHRIEKYRKIKEGEIKAGGKKKSKKSKH